MLALLPPLSFGLAWLFALLGWEPFGAAASTPFDERALRWMLLLGLGWSLLGGALAHTVLAHRTAAEIGWQPGGFQYEIGFASLGAGLAAIYASTVDVGAAWVVGSLAGGVFLFLAGLNHVREIVAERNFAPGNTVILVSDFGIPVSLLALLIATGAL